MRDTRATSPKREIPIWRLGIAAIRFCRRERSAALLINQAVGSSQSSRAINKALGLQGQEVYLQSHDQMQYMDHIESPMSHCRNIFLMYIVGHMGGGEGVVLICPVASSCGQPPGATPIHLSPHSFIPNNSALETNFLK